MYLNALLANDAVRCETRRPHFPEVLGETIASYEGPTSVTGTFTLFPVLFYELIIVIQSPDLQHWQKMSEKH
jgi:hypothetical protein